MRIVFIAQSAWYGVTPAGGADRMAFQLMEHLSICGWQTEAVIMGKPVGTHQVGPIKVHRVRAENKVDRVVKGADLIMTHLGGTPTAKRVGKQYGIPVVQLIHNSNGFTIGFLGSGCDFAIYNTEWLRDFHTEAAEQHKIIKDWHSPERSTVKRRAASNWPYIVVHPPVLETKRVGDPNGAVTLVNLTPNKGPDVFYALAERNKSTPFLGVIGGYEPEKQKLLTRNNKNISIHPHTSDVDEFYSKTSIILMPSIYESYGMVALEAMARGIPVIATDTPGLSECLGDGGILIQDRDNLDSWQAGLEQIQRNYAYWSELATNRADVLVKQSTLELQLFEKTMRELVHGSSHNHRR